MTMTMTSMIPLIDETISDHLIELVPTKSTISFLVELEGGV